MILILQEQRQGPRRQGDYSRPFTPPPLPATLLLSKKNNNKKSSTLKNN